MHNPTVSFVIPCYKLAHLLPDCVNSVLCQSFTDFEILIMDDCSPDNTQEVARSFRDPRIRYIRNDPNLGHLRNYNRGITLSRGKYVWLISADDYLLKSHVLQKYVDMLERHPNVGYTFCPGVAVGGGVDSAVQDWVSYGRTVHGDRDCIIRGRTFLKELIKGNTIASPSALVRRECYEQVSLFPLTMPWAGDWYLWCAFALRYDVGYFSEPMVCYREHELSMTKKMKNEGDGACNREETDIPWAIRNKALELGLTDISRDCLEAIAEIYGRRLASREFRASEALLTLGEVEQSIRNNCSRERERRLVRAHLFREMADQFYWQGDLLQARQFYNDALNIDPWMMKAQARRILLSLGGPGDFLWKRIKALL